MPLYEYECRVCKEKFEILQSIRDDGSKLQCPKCQADKPKRILSLFSSALSKPTSAACGPTGST
jgi:putative FmdB family regulatory protein